jgi:hypothetical protein
MLTRHVAIVADPGEIKISDLTAAASALQIQATRDFGPLWTVEATVTAFASLDDVPVGHWPIIILKSIPSKDDLGFHTDKKNQPYALVEYTDSWTITTSHEMLEMLADPFGNRLVPGPSINPDDNAARVAYFLELCDPCEDSKYAYSINGVLVSDFITPHFHDPIGSFGARYSFTGSINQPRQILPGGYISYDNPTTDKVYQAMADDKGNLQFKELGPMKGGASLREFSHAEARKLKLPTAYADTAYNSEHARVKEAAAFRARAKEASASIAERLRRELPAIPAPSK